MMGEYKGPIVSVIKDKEVKDALDPSYVLELLVIDEGPVRVCHQVLIRRLKQA